MRRSPVIVDDVCKILGSRPKRQYRDRIKPVADAAVLFFDESSLGARLATAFSHFLPKGNYDCLPRRHQSAPFRPADLCQSAFASHQSAQPQRHVTHMGTSPLLPTLIATLEAGASAAPPTALASDELAKINGRVSRAWVGANEADLRELLRNDYLLTDHHGNWTERETPLVAMRRPSEWVSVGVQDVVIRVFGRVGVVQGVFVLTARDARVTNLRYTDVYLWSRRGWRLVNSQHTAIAEGVDSRLQQGAAGLWGPWRGENPVGNDLQLLRNSTTTTSMRFAKQTPLGTTHISRLITWSSTATVR